MGVEGVYIKHLRTRKGSVKICQIIITRVYSYTEGIDVYVYKVNQCII